MGVGPIEPDAGSGSGVDATGVTAGYVPTAQGDDTFDWEPVEIDLSSATAATPATSDYLVGTDTSNADANAKFLVSEILALSTVTQYTDEMARDALGAALVAGPGITITPNDGADTITVGASGAQNPSTSVFLLNECLNAQVNVAESFMVYSASSGVIAAAPASAGRFGIANMHTSTSATGRATVYSANAAMIAGGGEMTFEAAVYIPDLSTSGERFIIRAGFMSSTSVDPPSGAWFEYDESTSANWRICTGKNTSRTKTTTSSAVPEDTWQTLKVVINAAATSVEFFINGVSVGTIATTLPTDVAQDYFGSAVGIIKSAGTTARAVWVDYVTLAKTFTTPR